MAMLQKRMQNSHCRSQTGNFKDVSFSLNKATETFRTPTPARGRVLAAVCQVPPPTQPPSLDPLSTDGWVFGAHQARSGRNPGAWRVEWGWGGGCVPFQGENCFHSICQFAQPRLYITST